MESYEAVLGGEQGVQKSRRRQDYKSSVGAMGGARRRRQMMSVGKEKREALVQAKRMRHGPCLDRPGEDDMADDVAVGQPMEDAESAQEQSQRVNAAVGALASAVKRGPEGAEERVTALRSLRRLLSDSSSPPLLQAVQAGVVPLLVECIPAGAPDDQVLEGAWCLTNIASGTHDESVTVMPAMPSLVVHLGASSSGAAVKEQCAWALGNLAGDSEEVRRVLLERGALSPLAKLLATSADHTLAKTTAWALSNLVKDTRAAKELMRMDGIVESILNQLATGNAENVKELSWMLTYVTAMTDAEVDKLVRGGIMFPLLRSLSFFKEPAVQIPVLRTLANIIGGPDNYTDAVLTAGQGLPGGAVGVITSCVESGNRILQKEGAWALSNIAAGTHAHKETVFRGGAVPPLLHLLATSAFDVRKEAAFAIGNICVAPRNSGCGAGATQKGLPVILSHLTAVVDLGCVPGFINLVRSPDPEAARLGLTFLEMVLRALPNKRGVKVVEKEDGIDAIESLQFNENEDLRNFSNALVDTYYGEDYGLEEEYGTEGAMLPEEGSPTEYPPWRTGRNMMRM